jgi:nucleoside permease NupC
VQVLWGIGGMVVLLAIAFGLSTNRRAINPRTVFGALAIQVVLGIVILYWGAGKQALQALSNAVQAVIGSSNEGIEFLFGPVLPEKGLVFAFQVLPVIIFFAALTSVLYHWGILQWVVKLDRGHRDLRAHGLRQLRLHSHSGRDVRLHRVRPTKGGRPVRHQGGPGSATLANLMNATIAGILIG